MRVIAAIVVSLCVALAGAVNAAEFEVSYLDGGSWNSIYAQGFSPSVSPNPNLGLGAGDTVSLTEFSFFKSGNADNNNDIKLAIITPFFADLTGLSTSSSILVGLSDNTLSGTGSIATDSAITFNFSNLQLTYGGEYAAVFVSQSGNALTPELVPAIITDYVETPPGSGTYLPESNYGTSGQFQYSTSNFLTINTFGTFFSGFSAAGDANFVATFNVVPEPCSALLALSCLAMTALSRSQRG